MTKKQVHPLFPNQKTMKMLPNSLGSSPAGFHSPVSRLNERELEILKLLGEGRDCQSIARLLRVSFETVEAHRRNIQMILNLTGPALMQHRAH